MLNGPSKEALAEYFRNNRKYFDSLANQYRLENPEYYNKYIAPFYNNPFHASGSSKRSGCSLKLVSVLSALIFIAAAAGVVFYISSGRIEHDVDREIDRQIDKAIKQVQPDNVKPENTKKSMNPADILDTLSSVQSMSDFQKGMIYYRTGDYDKAESYFAKVKRDDPGFNEARKKLTEIRKIKLEEVNKIK